MQTTSSAELIRHLAHRGLDRVFLVPGESYLGIMDALYDNPSISTNICRHESGAGFMAVSDAKLTGRPALVCVSRGPGLTNASIALHTAQQDAVPLICVIGQVPAADVRKGAFQEIDYQLMLGGICKRVIEIREAADFVRAANTAWDVAMEGTPGPVAIVIPEDLQDIQMEQAPLVQSCTSRPALSRSDLETLQRAVAQARRPVIIAGGQMETEAGRAALHDLATSLGAPVLISFRRQHAIDFDHPNYCGELGLAPSPQVLRMLEDADCILALGTRLGDICSQGYALFDRMPATQTLWHLSQHLEDHRHRHPDMRRFAVDPVDAAERLVATGVTGERRADWLGQFQALHQAHTTISEWKHEDAAVDFRCAPGLIRKHTRGQANVVVDAGTFAAPFYRYLPTDKGLRLLSPLSGAMGFGVPGAVAAALREPHRKTVCLCGDGGFMMTGSEMAIAVQRNLNILFIVSNNSCYASIRIHQERFYPGRVVGTDLFNPRFDGIAQAWGIPGRHVDTAADFDNALAELMPLNGPALVEVATSLSAVLPVSRA